MFGGSSVEKSTLCLQASTIQAASVPSADTEDELAHYNHSYGLECVQASDLSKMDITMRKELPFLEVSISSLASARHTTQV